MAGHSAWKNIKHRKAAVDARRGKMWSKCARAIIVAARTGGGDPDANLSLRYAIDDARAVNMPKDTIEKAIKKGTGELQAENFESALYEGYGPGGVAILLEILTDNRNRTAPEIKKIFELKGGNLGASGCVSYLFASRGLVVVPAADVPEDQIMQIALDAGAEDISRQGDDWQLLCEPAQLITLRKALDTAGLNVASAQLTMVPATSVVCSGETARKVLALVEALDEHDDVQKVHANFEIPDEELASLR